MLSNNMCFEKCSNLFPFFLYSYKKRVIDKIFCEKWYRIFRPFFGLKKLWSKIIFGSKTLSLTFSFIVKNPVLNIMNIQQFLDLILKRCYMNEMLLPVVYLLS